MISEESLTALRESLPYDSTKRIKAKLHRTSAAAIADALKDPNTKRTDILEAAVEVAKEFKQQFSGINEQIQQLAS